MNLSDMKYWEDVIGAPVKRFGPLVFSTALMEHLLDLMGEKHPIHDSEEFARSVSRHKPIVPGGFIHSITSGWVAQHSSSPVAIVGMRSLNWDFVRPLYPDTPFFFTIENESTEEIDERLGMVKSVRRVFDENERTLAIGRLSAVILRRPLQSHEESEPETELLSAPTA
jgi:acyl dehydratase